MDVDRALVDVNPVLNENAKLQCDSRFALYGNDIISRFPSDSINNAGRHDILGPLVLLTRVVQSRVPGAQCLVNIPVHCQSSHF